MVSVAGHTSGTDLSENFRRGVDPKRQICKCDHVRYGWTWSGFRISTRIGWKTQFSAKKPTRYTVTLYILDPGPCIWIYTEHMFGLDTLSSQASSHICAIYTRPHPTMHRTSSALLAITDLITQCNVPWYPYWRGPVGHPTRFCPSMIAIYEGQNIENQFLVI